MEEVDDYVEEDEEVGKEGEKEEFELFLEE